MGYKKSFESMNTFDEGNNCVDFWEWYYRKKFKEYNELMYNGKKNYFVALQEHYLELLLHKEFSQKNLNSENFVRRHSANGLLNQLKAIEIVFAEENVELN